MSGFLANMIDRHQGAVTTVQPRIRSMFESEPAQPIKNDDFAVATNEIAKHDVDTKVDRPSGFVPPSNPVEHAPDHAPAASLSIAWQLPFQPDESVKAAGFNSLDSSRLDLMNAQIQSVLARLGRRSESPKLDDEHVQQKAGFPSHISSPTTDKVKLPDTGIPDGIEETLSRIRSEISRVTKAKQGLPAHDFSSPVTVQTRDSDLPTVLPLNRPEEKSENFFGNLTGSFKQPEQIDAVPTDQSGALLVPDWLAALQAELNNRWPDVNAHSESERVVNVTIGRVEIRATNPGPAQQASALEKPKGVLSLDDYLKQRECKGRS